MASETEKPVPLKTFVYPFQKTETPRQGPAKTVEVVDPQTYYSALAGAEDGFYPIGANGQWHGGVHFGSQTGGVLAQDAGIRCVADGEVIAYRIDSVYPTVTYSSCAAATYSTGFVLVRHRLQLPPAPASTTTAAGTPATPAPAAQVAATPAASATAADATTPGATAPASATPAPATATPATPAQEPSLILYSLYMHLLHWKAYQDDATKLRPACWGNASQLVVAGKAVDGNPYLTPTPPDLGINVRAGNTQNASKIGWLPPGTRLTVEAGAPGWRRIVSIDSGAMTPDPVNTAAADAPLGWTFTNELDPAPAEPKVTDAIHVLDTPFTVKSGDLMGYLGQYQNHSDIGPLSTSCVERPLVQLDVFTGDDIEAFLTKSRARAAQLPDSQKTLLLVETGATLAQPTAADQKTLDGEGVTVDSTSPKTGEWVKVRKGAVQIVAKTTLSGYDSTTGRYANGAVLSRILDARGTAIELAAYNALDATGQAAYTQREVMVPSGEPVWVQRSVLGTRPVTAGYEMEVWSKFPLQASNTDGPLAAYPRVAGIKTLDKSALEADGTRWWQVIVGISDGSPRSGWAREKGQAKVRLCTPWDWPGFELVAADSTTPAAFYANHIANLPDASAEERSTLQPQGASVPSAPLFDTLYTVIDSDHDNVLTSTEIRQALQQPWLAQAISRLITRYDSEWSGPMAKWDAIDALIPEASQDDWAEEKTRIETLLWWDGVKGKHGFPESPAVTHFHPVGTIANFSGKARSLVTKEMLRLIFPNAPDDRLTIVADGINLNIDTGKLDSEERLTHFFGQVRQETGPRMAFREDLNYSSDGLFNSKFGYYHGNRERSDRDANNEEAIANNAYDDANRGRAYKIGNIQLGDGWLYRGRGLKQLTGRSNYHGLTSTHARIWGENVDFEANPDIVNEPTYAVRSALAFWVDKNFTYMPMKASPNHQQIKLLR